MRWTTVRALCRRLTVAAVTLTMVTGSLPVGAFAEVLTTDSTFVQTDVDQVDAADAAAATPRPMPTPPTPRPMPALPTPQRSMPVTPLRPRPPRLHRRRA